MATPVSGVNNAPLFGGLTGYKRDAPSRPTSVPGALPANRGTPNKPGDAVRAPTVRASYNRQDRGTNVLIPYSRVVPLHHLTHVGRVQPGDVIFHSTYRVNRGYAVNDPRDPNVAPSQRSDRIATESRVVGIDWLNRQLGGRPEYDSRVGSPNGKHTENWVVGETVILGSPTDTPDLMSQARANIGKGFAPPTWDPVRDNVADEWRSLPILREWVCDGVVLSNDEPQCHTSNGTNDSQLFNIGVQGVCTVSNGYCDFKGGGVESQHRSFGSTKDGYNDGGEPFVHNLFEQFGGESYHNHYPLQMFDRKLRPMDTIHVGLVCTKRVLDDMERRRLVEQTPALAKKRDDHQRINPSATETDCDIAAIPASVDSFYTFHYVCFSSNQAWLPSAVARYNPRTGAYEGVEEVRVHALGLAEPSSKKASKHYEEAKRGETFDPYVGPSRREFEGMVGAWKVGKVLDISAQKRDPYTGGPVDTTTAITVNVCVEFSDWRALRRGFNRPDIGMRAPGARPWVDEQMVIRRGVQAALTAPLDQSATPLPPADYLGRMQSRYKDGREIPPEDNAVERARWDEWMQYLYVHARGLAVQRLELVLTRQGPNQEEVLVAGKDMRLDNDGGFSEELALLAVSMGGARDDERVMHWPTAYVPLTTKELTNISDQVRKGAANQDWDVIKDAYITSTPRTTIRFDDRNLPNYEKGRAPYDETIDDVLDRDDVRFKLVHNMPLDMSTLTGMADLVGPKLLGQTQGFDRPHSMHTDQPNDAARRIAIRADLFRRDGLSQMPSNRMQAHPTMVTVNGKQHYANHPVGWRGPKSYKPGTEEYVLATMNMSPDQVAQFARDALTADEYDADFSEDGRERQELHDLRNDELTQWAFYENALTVSRDLHRAGYGIGFRGRVLRNRRTSIAGQSDLKSYTSPAAAQVIDALWASLTASLPTGYSPEAIGLVEWIEWLRTSGVHTGTIVDAQGNGLVIPGRILKHDGARAKPDALSLAQVGSTTVPEPRALQNLAKQAISGAARKNASPGRNALADYVIDWQLMSMLDNLPGVSKDDFIDYYAPQTKGERRDNVSHKMHFRGDMAERFLGLIETPLAFSELGVAAITRMHQISGNPGAPGPATNADAGDGVGLASESNPLPAAATDTPAGSRAASKAPVRRRATPPAQKAKAGSAAVSAPLAATLEPEIEIEPSRASPSLAAPVEAAAAAPPPPATAEPATPAAPARGARQRHGTDGSAAQTADVFASIFGGGGSSAATSAAAAASPTPAPASTSAAADPAPSPSAGSEDGAAGTGSGSNRQRVRRPRDGR